MYSVCTSLMMMMDYKGWGIRRVDGGREGGWL